MPLRDLRLFGKSIAVAGVATTAFGCCILGMPAKADRVAGSIGQHHQEVGVS